MWEPADHRHLARRDGSSGTHGAGKPLNSIHEIWQSKVTLGLCTDTRGFEPGDELVLDTSRDAANPGDSGFRSGLEISDGACCLVLIGAPEVANGRVVGRHHHPIP